MFEERERVDRRVQPFNSRSLEIVLGLGRLNLVRGLASVGVVDPVERHRADRCPLVLMVEQQSARTVAPATIWKPDKARRVETHVLMIRVNTHTIAELGRRAGEGCGPVGGHSDHSFRFANGPDKCHSASFDPCSLRCPSGCFGRGGRWGSARAEPDPGPFWPGRRSPPSCPSAALGPAARDPVALGQRRRRRATFMAALARKPESGITGSDASLMATDASRIIDAGDRTLAVAARLDAGADQVRRMLGR